MTQIEAVLFDFGGVVTGSPFEGFARYEAEQGLPKDLIRTLNSTHPDTNAWAKFERSEVDAEGFKTLFEAEAAALGHEVSAEAVLDCLKNDLRPRMVDAVSTIAQSYKTAVLTNNLTSHDDDQSNTPTGDMTAVLGVVDVVVESSVVGIRKPEPRFYEIACEQLGVEPSACVFLDDLGINLKPARAMGMTTFKVVDHHQTLDELGALLNLKL